MIVERDIVGIAEATTSRVALIQARYCAPCSTNAKWLVHHGISREFLQISIFPAGCCCRSDIAYNTEKNCGQTRDSRKNPKKIYTEITLDQRLF
jgi:hypothetical protein